LCRPVGLATVGGVTIRTIGHSSRPIETFVALLEEHGVESLVDVRRYPGSRKNPHFNRDALEASLGDAGIGYVHEVDLGGRRRVNADSRNTAWRNSGFRGYADWMASAEFRDALTRLIEGAAGRGTAIMCAESVPWRCHRNLIADALVLAGIDVVHIIDAGQAGSHEVNESARLAESGHVIYPSTGPQIDLI
jgi:uncharacterized protein (DUF488 family)